MIIDHPVWFSLIGKSLHFPESSMPSSAAIHYENAINTLTEKMKKESNPARF
jgi:hypothetical protein